MATKSKKRNSPAKTFEQAQRCFQRGLFKQALKGAKLAYRREASTPRRLFLERAYLARGRELCRFGLRDESREVVRNLLDFGVTDPSVEVDLPPLQVALGMLDRVPGRNKEEALQTGSPLLLAAADHAVLRPQETPASLPDICRGALHVRAALEALENGDEELALTQLKDIARSSPLADWKYLVRGLAAYYRQDGESMRANWARLDPSRFAARIAATLEALDRSESGSGGDRDATAAVRTLEHALLGGSLLSRLEQLRAHVAADRWQEVMQVLKKSQYVFRKLDRDLLDRVVAVLLSMVLAKRSRRRLSDLTATLPPPAIDPRWNRAWAMLCESSPDECLEDAESYWRSYADDLAGLPSLMPAEQTLARALVFLRIGRMLFDECNGDPGPFGTDEEYLDRLRTQAIECFTESLSLAPRLLAAHEALAKAELACGRPDRAAEAYRGLLEHFPDNLDALLWLVQHHLVRDEPFQTRPYVERARRLKPLDKKIRGLAWATHCKAARHFALAGEWDRGRAELDAADRLDRQSPDRYSLLVRRAVFELKAKNFTLARQWLDEAEARFDEPTPVLLMAAVEAVRYALPKVISSEFQHRWTTALKRRCHTETAGAMCSTMAAYLRAGVDYPDRPAHIRRLLAYVRRCSRVKWLADDLREVCSFLGMVAGCREFRESFPDAAELQAKYLRKGHKRFPKSPFFQYWAGDLEMRKGPARCNRRRALRCFERAVTLAESSDNPADTAVADAARRRLTFLGEAGWEKPPGFDDGLPELFDDASAFANGMPPEIADVVAMLCRMTGMAPEDVLRKAMADIMSMAGGEESGPENKRRKKNKKQRKRRR